MFETGTPLSSDGGDGVNLMVHKVARDDTLVAEKGQRHNVFQSICKIKNKDCKVIIDGGSYNNIISNDLVEALGLSIWRQPQPHYVKWLNGVGKLKVTHRANVPFSVGTYADKMACDVVPMQACHLLLGRPRQFDHNVTHHGRSNKYSFMHHVVNHVLEPMVEEKIKDENFPEVKKYPKKNSKPRTILLEGREDDMAQVMIKEDNVANHVLGNVTLPEKPKEDRTIVYIAEIPLQISCSKFPPLSTPFWKGPACVEGSNNLSLKSACRHNKRSMI